jgi:hypothetical protein
MIAHLNDVPESLLREARSLSDGGLIKALLMRHTDPDAWEYLDSFVEAVVLGGEDVARWRRGQVVVPDFSLADQLRLEPVDLLAPLGGELSRRVTPSLADWRAGVSWVGAPALVLPDADYTYAPPERTVGLGASATEEVADRDVALRRWIAARLARSAPSGAACASPEALIASCPGLPPLREWSRDAVLAARGLIHEHAAMGAAAGGVPGMRGPDEWYRD